MDDASIQVTLHEHEGKVIYAVAECDGVSVGWATFILDEPDGCAFCLNIEISPQYRRRYIMSQMYSEVERRIGRPLSPSQQLTPESAAYWDKRGVPLHKDTVIKTAEQRTKEDAERPRMRFRDNGVDVPLLDKTRDNPSEY
ncbi:GNAT family N-acetyltransferase [Azospirillum himalayense]|uniref:GNAT family N-acetyltransferase n=1 Tax=Azospirillum himalayense TaxID=654847 RepID=A0ABW0FZJ6_9PROT